jgi:hypothetical protein
LAPLNAELTAFSGAIRKRLEEERIEMLPPDAQAAVRKPENQRTWAERKLVDDYTVPLRVDPIKVKELLPPDAQKRFDELQEQINALNAGGEGGGGRRAGGFGSLQSFCTVKVDTAKLNEPSYILSSAENRIVPMVAEHNRTRSHPKGLFRIASWRRD